MNASTPEPTTTTAKADPPKLSRQQRGWQRRAIARHRDRQVAAGAHFSRVLPPGLPRAARAKIEAKFGPVVRDIPGSTSQCRCGDAFEGRTTREAIARRRDHERTTGHA